MLHSAITHSGNLLSGNVGRVHLASGTLLIQSGDVASGSVQGFFGDRDIASGTVGVFDFGSGAVIAGTVGSGAVVSGNVASGQLGINHHASGGLVSGWAFGSGSLYGRLGPQFLIASGTIGTFDIGSGQILSGLIASGQVGQGHYASGSFLSGFHFTSGSVFGRLAGGPFLIASGTIDGLEIGSGAIRSGNYASGSISHFKIEALAITSGQVGSGTLGGMLGNREIASGTVGFHDVGSGQILSGLIASGQVGYFHIRSVAANSLLGRSPNTAGTVQEIGGGSNGDFVVIRGTDIVFDGLQAADLYSIVLSGAFAPAISFAIVSGTVGSGAVYGRLAGGDFTIASGTIDGLEIGSGALRSGNYASGSVGSFHLSSGLILNTYLGSGAVQSGAYASGSISHFKIEANAVRSGNLGSGSVVGSWISGLSQSIASGTIGPADIASGTIFPGTGIGVTLHLSGITITATGAEPVDPGQCDLRLSLNSDLPVTVSGDIMYVTTTSGRTTSGTATLFVGSGVISGICPGMVVVGSGIPVGSFITLISGSTSLTINNNTTLSVSGGATIQFWPSAIYAMPFRGRKIALTDGTNWSGYVWTSGAGSRLLMYDNRQTGNIKSGASFNAMLSGLTDTFQLVRGMLVVASGYYSSGTVIASVDGATNLTVSANSVSGANGVPILFMLPPTSGGVSSGALWDVFATARSGVPWLQFGNQWISGNSRLDLLYQEQSGGVLVNSGVIN